MKHRVRREFGCRYGMALLSTLAAWSPATAQSSTDLYSYDAKGRLIQLQTGQGAKSVYTFDRSDNRSNVTVERQFDTSWTGASLPHQTGFAETWGGWAANVLSPQGYMTYGPYTTAVAAGVRNAVWRIMIDNSTYPDPATVVVLEVFDATTGEIISRRDLTWTSFNAPSSYQIFELPFIVDAARVGHTFEFRTYHTGLAYLNVDKIGLY